jgi:iron(III) transport system permease protein
VSKAGGVVTYQRIWSTVAGSTSSTQEVAWTLWHATLASIIAVPLAFVLGHRLARRGGAWLSLLALLPLALPPVFLAIGYVRLTSGLEFTIPGLVEHRNPFTDPDSPRFAVSSLLVAKYVSFAVAALWASFLEVDPSLEEAAATAGVKTLDRALGILAPLVRPALSLSVVVVFVFSLREIDSIVLLGTKTVMHKIYDAVHIAMDNQVAALSVILVVLQAIPFALLALFSDRGARTLHAPSPPASDA